MRVLIIGCTGFIGRSVAARASARDLEVFGTGRSPEPHSFFHGRYLCSDRNDPDQVLRFVRDYDISVVVDMIPMVQSSTRSLLARLDTEIEQYVMISSADVYANYNLIRRRCSGTVFPGAADESSALRQHLYPYRKTSPRPARDPDRYLDDYDKIPLEAEVRKMSSSWTILRLPMVYGPGDPQDRFAWAIDPMLRKCRELTIPSPWAAWVTTHGYIENVSHAIASSLANPLAYEQVFNIAEETPVSQLTWARRFAAVLDWHGEIRLTDDPTHPMSERIAQLDLTVPLKIDGARIRTTLGVADVVNQADALSRTVASTTAAQIQGV
ncbi:MAG: NAD-dependent epimerase/dehydratase family protein [Pseudomonadota bacterium]